MSKENLSKFMNQVADSEELQAQIGEGIDAEALIALGADGGCEFTAEDLLELAEISEEELDAVAGGRKIYPNTEDLKNRSKLKKPDLVFDMAEPKLTIEYVKQGSRLVYADCKVASPCPGYV
tara:strand:+ start:88 stop:453 length:366 start_codon:yes stop_codon:yes gene_type:complete